MVEITVAMPVRNARAFLPRAVESVLRQRHPSFELLLFDDASTDGSAEIVRAYRSHPKVRAVLGRKHRGRGAVRNRILALAKGRYMTPCDADDVMLPGHLSFFSRYLDRHPEVAVVYGDVRKVTLDSRGRARGRSRRHGRDCEAGWDLVANAVNHPGCMMRTGLVRRVGGYDPRVDYCEDWGLWLKLAEIARFKYLPGRCYYVWQRHPGSVRRVSARMQADAARMRLEAVRRRYGRRG